MQEKLLSNPKVTALEHLSLHNCFGGGLDDEKTCKFPTFTFKIQFLPKIASWSKLNDLKLELLGFIQNKKVPKCIVLAKIFKH